MSRPTTMGVDHRGFSGHQGVRSWEWAVASLLLSTLVAMPALIASPAAAGSVPCDCQSCHGDHHGDNWAGCSACHDSPPQTGSHLAHYNSAPLMSLRYGDTSVDSTADAYLFGCGNCHPLDSVNHRNNTVDIELYNPAAPAGSIKAKNPADAAYTAGVDPATGTCSNVYCHSGNTFTSSAVGIPLTYPASAVPPGYLLNMSYIMDETCSNLTYDPYTVISARSYATTPPWGTSGTFGACTECHEFPLTTYAPEVSAGVGDSHQWVDDTNGWNWRHAYNMGFDAIPCRTCHNTTVTAAAGSYWAPAGRNGEWIVAYNPVPLASRIPHVNGVPDVAFDTVDLVPYRENLSLVGASYEPSTKTCSNVSCHYNPTGSSQRWQQKVQWGGPWRYGEPGTNAECDVCHRYGYIQETCTPAP